MAKLSIQVTQKGAWSLTFDVEPSQRVEQRIVTEESEEGLNTLSEIAQQFLADRQEAEELGQATKLYPKDKPCRGYRPRGKETTPREEETDPRDLADLHTLDETPDEDGDPLP
jgi:DNA-binding protein H-NS